MTEPSPLAQRLLPPSVVENPRLSRWVTIATDGTVILRSGKVELGQGIATALAQLAADELGVDVARIRVQPVSTTGSPDEGFTSASQSIEYSGPAVRQVCAEIRELFLEHAARQLVSRGGLQLDDGTIIDEATGATTSYWELASEVSLERDASGLPQPRPLDTGKTAGRSVARLDLVAKLTGGRSYIQDLALPGMLHGRIVRPPSIGAHLVSIAWQPPDGTILVRDGSFLGVITECEEGAVELCQQVQRCCTWSGGDLLPDENRMNDFLRSAPSDTEVLAEGKGPVGVADRTLRASYSRPFLAHGSIGPSCAIAQWRENTLHVWCSSQGIYPLRIELARVFSMDANDIVVEHVDGSGCYGHNGADDAAYEAALLARATGGRPVRLQWTRADELCWSPFGSAMSADVEATLADDGTITRWNYDVWSLGHLGRPGRGAPAPNLLAATQLEEPFPRQPALDVPMTFGGGAGRNAVPIYTMPSRRIQSHIVRSFPLRTSSLRSLGAHLNVFAIESFVDELAHDVGITPVEFRLRHLDDERARAVIKRAAVETGLGTRDLPEGRGLGLGFARYKNQAGYCAVVAEVEAETELRVLRLTAVVDVGFVVNPDGLTNQISGGAIQATSWTVLERVRFDRERVTSSTWETYPILRFSDAPEVRVIVVDRPDDRPLGAGEIAQGPTAAAIGNSLFAALGVRVRDLPISRDRIIETLQV